jgi:hypothetical protein
MRIGISLTTLSLKRGFGLLPAVFVLAYSLATAAPQKIWD